MLLHRAISGIYNGVDDDTVLECLAWCLATSDTLDKVFHLFVIPIDTCLVREGENPSGVRFGLFEQVGPN